MHQPATEAVTGDAVTLIIIVLSLVVSFWWAVRSCRTGRCHCPVCESHRWIAIKLRALSKGGDDNEAQGGQTRPRERRARPRH